MTVFRQVPMAVYVEIIPSYYFINNLLNLTQSAFQGLGVIKPLPNCEQPVNLKPHGPVGLKNSYFHRGPSHSTDFGVKEPYTVKPMNIFGH